MANDATGLELFLTEIKVSDWASTVRWYVETLGMRLLLEDAEHQYALLGSGRGRLALKGGSPKGLDRDHVRLIIQVEDLEAEQERLVGRGVALSPPSTTRKRATARSGCTTPRGRRSASSVGSPEDDSGSGGPGRPIGLLEALMRLALSRTIVIALAVVALAVPGPVLAQDPPKFENVSSAPPRTPEEERKGFHLPPGFEIELVASEPDIGKPLNMAFDARGRLWVTESIEYPFAAEGTQPRDKVRILEDFRPDGKAGKVRVFADGLNIPIGVLPLSSGDEALVHSIPNIHRMGDTDGDGRADRRDVYYQSFGYKDTHGMTDNFTWGFDGWVYACHGFSNTSEVQGADEKPITMQSGNTYRMRPDGSHVEYFTHGQVNPFGLAFDPLGNLYSCDCHSRPLYQLLRGAWYPSFGKPDDGLGFGPEMLTHDHGSTAISGIVYYAADQFPGAFPCNLFIGNVVTNRINRDRLEWRGSTPKAIELPDFLTSDDPWFRPVDLELGPDGAMYVADFYNRIIGHYEVPLTHPGRDRERGRIWRIVYRGPDLPQPPARSAPAQAPGDPSFGKPDDGLGFGPQMLTHDHGSTAISGIVYYAADQFPGPFRDNLFIGNVVTNRINRDRLEWSGSTPKAIEMPDFLTSDDPWFRPVDLELGPDGAMYVADFYDRIIGHYEVPLTHPGRDRGAVESGGLSIGAPTPRSRTARQPRPDEGRGK